MAKHFYTLNQASELLLVAKEVVRALNYQAIEEEIMARFAS
ncbi:hypothetical protein P8S54_04550 [Thiomicrospira sp. R3]|nr:hypothetical protein [Thiomicrospira sp. R3]WFE69576.1 hypothetical protein P8S54_04550 [Thiomicrospira sp. R3]